MTKKDLLQGYIIAPNPDGVNLTKTVEGLDHFGNTVVSQVIEEKPLTIYLNSQEIVTAMTIGDYPEGPRDKAGDEKQKTLGLHEDDEDKKPEI